MKKVITRFFLSTMILGIEIFGNGMAIANTPQSNYISVIANVQLSGAIKKPGIYKVPSGTRLVDVLVKAGGLKKDAVITNLNLTSPVTDGTNFYIASKKDFEVKAQVKKPENRKIVLSKVLNNNSRRKNGKKQKQSPIQINLNSATEEELNSLPGIGEGLAKEIISYRNKNGRFKDISELNNVHGIGDKKIQRLKNKIVL